MVKRVVGVVLTTALAVASACSGDGSGPAPTSSTADPKNAYQVAYVALCLARASARIDVNTARTTFYDRSHDTLHTLAGALAPVDRELTARLLQAKEAVESDFRTEPVPPSLGPDLDRLVGVTGEALTRLAIPVERCR